MAKKQTRKLKKTTAKAVKKARKEYWEKNLRTWTGDPLLPESRYHLFVFSINKADAGAVCHTGLQHRCEFIQLRLRFVGAKYCVIDHGFATTSK